MGRFKVLLWDIDATLLDFKTAERAGIRMGFRQLGLGECTEEMIGRYSIINDGYWKALERGKISKPEVLTGRFRDFFREFGLPAEMAELFNEHYQQNLGETICFNDHGYELVKELKGSVLQYAVTNGTRIAQEKKLRRSGLNGLLDGVFISEVIGTEKPMKGFFDAVFEKLSAYRKEEFLIVGDSLTSDMLGGYRAGICTCWYNPAGLANTQNIPVDHEIVHLEEVKDILKEGEQRWGH